MRKTALRLYPLLIQAVKGITLEVEARGDFLERWRELCGSSAPEVVEREKALQWWRGRLLSTVCAVEAIEAALLEVPPPVRDMLIYRYVNGESFSLIGARFGITEKTARRKGLEGIRLFERCYLGRLGT